MSRFGVEYGRRFNPGSVMHIAVFPMGATNANGAGNPLLVPYRWDQGP